MPPKSVKCVICGEEVSKRQTYLVDEKTGERACKRHQEAQDAKESLERQREDEKARKESERRERRQQMHSHGEARMPTSPSCMLCRREGVYEADAFARLAVNMEKGRLLSKDVNPFLRDSWHLKQTKAELGGAVILKAFPLEQSKHVSRQLKGWLKDAAQLLGFVALCFECAEKAKMDWAYDMPKVDLETLALIGAAAKDAVSKQAIKEIFRDA